MGLAVNAPTREMWMMIPRASAKSVRRRGRLVRAEV